MWALVPPGGPLMDTRRRKLQNKTPWHLGLVRNHSVAVRRELLIDLVWTAHATQVTSAVWAPWLKAHFLCWFLTYGQFPSLSPWIVFNKAVMNKLLRLSKFIQTATNLTLISHLHFNLWQNRINKQGNRITYKQFKDKRRWCNNYSTRQFSCSWDRRAEKNCIQIKSRKQQR